MYTIENMRRCWNMPLKKLVILTYLIKVVLTRANAQVPFDMFVFVIGGR